MRQLLFLEDFIICLSVCVYLFCLSVPKCVFCVYKCVSVIVIACAFPSVLPSFLFFSLSFLLVLSLLYLPLSLTVILSSNFCFFSVLNRSVLEGCPKLRGLNLSSCRGVPRGLKQHHIQPNLRTLVCKLTEMGFYGHQKAVASGEEESSEE